MNNRIKDQLNLISRFLEELNELNKYESFDSYLQDTKGKAACERFFEKIIQASVDLTFMVIKDKSLPIPADEESSFSVLAKSNIINQEIAIKLENAKRMRNILAHQYGTINDELVFKAVTQNVTNDVDLFITQIEESLQ